MMQHLIDIDTQAFLALNGLHADWLDQIVYAFSGRAIWLPMYAAIAMLMVVRLGWKRGLLAIVAIGIAVSCSDVICARLIRPAVERLRPANLDNPISALVHIVNNYRGGPYGFPSCHATNTFALAVSSSLFLRYRWYAIFIFAWALLQCYSRIYLGVHYLGDIAAGACIGTCMGLLWYFLAAKASVWMFHRKITPTEKVQK